MAKDKFSEKIQEDDSIPKEKKLTPMMEQYMNIKEEYPECILFFRMGDFYEMFLEDAKIASEVLGITLTQRSKGTENAVPMAGVPYHAVSSYLNKFVRAGYKIAIVEQLSDPKAPGLVERGVIRIVTPGTQLDETALEKKENSYIGSLFFEKDITGFVVSDISTGSLEFTEVNVIDNKNDLEDLFSKYNIVEVIVNETQYNTPEVLKLLKDMGARNVFPVDFPSGKNQDVTKAIEKDLNIKSLISIGLDSKNTAIKALYQIVNYLKYTQREEINHIKKIQEISSSNHLKMDRSTIVNLELLATLRDHEKRGSLVDQIDCTETAMGGRMLKSWMLKPLVSKDKIDKRLDMVEKYKKSRGDRNALREQLKQISDLERLISRISLHQGNPRDLVSLKNSLKTSLQVIKTIRKNKTVDLENKIIELTSSDIEKIIKEIEEKIVEDPPVDPKQGGVIKSNVNLELDRLNKTINKSKEWIAELEIKEKQKTGITNLKVKFNKVFGYYIEVSKSNLDLVPEYFDRKQTLVNAERFITPELKEHEEIILTAEDTINDLEYEIFKDVISKVNKNIIEIQNLAYAVAITDCILSFSEKADLNDYIKPKITEDGVINIKDGRHPVVEKLLEEHTFVPNDVLLDNKKNQLWIITGPNMAGKSVFIRQVALLVLMTQMGSFIPATEATVSVTDKIFVRSGASDVITSGLSTFMVEMVETANILNNATSDSLIIMDEIGRGTSTYDGISIAWAVAEHLVSNTSDIYPKTLFATHYHELEKLEEKFSNKVSNYQLAVENAYGDPVFLHKIVAGGAGHSYGIAVAKLAGIPKEVTDRAEEILYDLENSN